MVWIDGKERVLHAIKENLCLKIDAMMNGNIRHGTKCSPFVHILQKVPWRYFHRVPPFLGTENVGQV